MMKKKLSSLFAAMIYIAVINAQTLPQHDSRSNCDVIPKLTISQSPKVLCAAGNATFTAYTLNAGAIAYYEWRINGTLAADTTATLQATVGTNDTIICKIVPQNGCDTTALVSVFRPLVASSGIPTSMSVFGYPNGGICFNTPFILKANVLASPANIYVWSKGGVVLDTTTEPNYTLYNSTVGRVICKMIYNAGCPSQRILSDSEYVAVSANERVFVKAGATGNGSSWNNAYGDLQQAIDSANGCTEIWVAAGTYKPTHASYSCQDCNSERTYAFPLKNKVSLYGGFAGTESELEQRNIAANPTILSGNIGSTTTNQDNTYHVVVTHNSTYTAVLDGFIVEGGRADSIFSNNVIISNNFATTISNYTGGGIWGAYSEAYIRNCTLRNNYAMYGGGMSTEDHTNIITDCVFENNTAQKDGGGIRFNSTSKRNPVTRCIFKNNIAGERGGGVSLPRGLEQCVFLNNTAAIGGGAVSADTIINCVFAGNIATSKGGGIDYNFASINCVFYNNASPTGSAINSANKIYNCIIKGNNGTAVTPYINGPLKYMNVLADNNIQAPGLFLFEPEFIDTLDLDGADNKWFTADDGLMVQCTSAAVDAGDNFYLNKKDITGSQTVNLRDIGAYEMGGEASASVFLTQPSGTMCSSDTITIHAITTGAASYAAYNWQLNGMPLNNTAAYLTLTNLANDDMVTVSYIPGYSCTSGANSFTDTVTLNVNQLGVNAPVVTANDSIVFCSGDSVTLSANGYYSWSNGEINQSSISASTTGAYYAWATDTNGCRAYSNSFSVIVNEVPPTPDINVSGNLLMTSAFAGYQWYFNGAEIPGATNQGYTATASGAYGLRVVNNAGCWSEMKTRYVTVSGINDVLSNSIKIYPNPTSGIFNIVFEHGVNRVITITNAIGQVVIVQRTESSLQQTIDISALGNGVYTITIIADDEKSIQRIVKQ